MMPQFFAYGLVTLLIASCIQASDFEGSQVWRVFSANDAQAEALHAHRDEFDFWTDTRGGVMDIRTEPSNNATLFKLLNENRIKHALFIPDLGPIFSQQMKSITILRKSSGVMNWNNYQSTATIHNWLEDIASRNPDVAQVINIGKSYEKRPLKLIKLGVPYSNSRKKAFWIDGGFHAREWISPAVVTWFINEMLANKNKYMKVLEELDFYILPILNVDGYEYSRASHRFWRKTRSRTSNSKCIGVDPNRNFDFHWKGPGNSVNPCSEVYRGSKPFSEPETAAMRSFIQKMSVSNADWRVYISFHSYAQVILSSWGYTLQLPSDDDKLKILGLRAAAAVETVYYTDYKAGARSEFFPLGAGASDDWAKGSGYFPYSYTYEVRDTGRYGFVPPPSQIIPTAKETWEGVRVMAEAVRSMQ